MPAILLIDDNTLLLQFTAHNLRAAMPDVEVHTADSCMAARAFAGEAEFGVLIVDRHLPDGDGIALFEELRSALGDPEGILVTAECDEDVRREARGRGFSAVMEKPYEAEVLERYP